METVRRNAPLILAGLLLFSLGEAIIVGGRGSWFVVAIVALLLALVIWQRRRAEP